MAPQPRRGGAKSSCSSATVPSARTTACQQRLPQRTERRQRPASSPSPRSTRLVTRPRRISSRNSSADQPKRFALMREAFRLEREDVAHIPLHQQPIVWAAKRNIELHQAPDNQLRLWLVTVN